LGRGYSFDAIRAKILFTEGVVKERRPLYDRRNFRKESGQIKSVLLDSDNASGKPPD
jgi:hypothetical protein